MERQRTMTPRRPRRALATLPTTMRAAAIDRFGGPEVVTTHTLPVPQVNAGEVLIAVHTSGIAGWDADMRDGWSPTGKQPKLPFIPGTDGSGTVVALGAGVRRLEIGDRVYGASFETAGFHAEYIAVAAENVGKVPSGLELDPAGATPLTGVTALQGVDEALKLKRGETVIVHGASGGVGTLAVQFAKLRGARVLATASGEDGAALARRLGADAAVDGRHGDIVAAARDFAPDGVDAVLGFAGGDALEQCLAGLRPGGRAAYPNGIESAPKKRSGLDLTSYDGVIGVRELARLNRAIEAAKLTVPIPAAYPLEEAAKAHRRVAEGHVLGKVVLRIG